MKVYKQANDIRKITLQQIGSMEIDADIFPMNYIPMIRVVQKDSNMIGSRVYNSYIQQGRLFVRAYQPDDMITGELMLRAYTDLLDNNKIHRKAVTVARVCFQNRRKGLMTELYKKLVRHVNQMDDLDTIVIEQVLQPEMKQWCLDNNFEHSVFYPGSYYKIIK